MKRTIFTILSITVLALSLTVVGCSDSHRAALDECVGDECIDIDETLDPGVLFDDPEIGGVADPTGDEPTGDDPADTPDDPGDGPIVVNNPAILTVTEGNDVMRSNMVDQSMVAENAKVNPAYESVIEAQEDFNKPLVDLACEDSNYPIICKLGLGMILAGQCIDLRDHFEIDIVRERVNEKLDKVENGEAKIYEPVDGSEYVIESDSLVTEDAIDTASEDIHLTIGEAEDLLDLNFLNHYPNLGKLIEAATCVIISEKRMECFTMCEEEISYPTPFFPNGPTSCYEFCYNVF